MQTAVRYVHRANARRGGTFEFGYLYFHPEPTINSVRSEVQSVNGTFYSGGKTTTTEKSQCFTL